jgi:hypothetical protein
MLRTGYGGYARTDFTWKMNPKRRELIRMTFMEIWWGIYHKKIRRYY